jgi:heterodisulfide reductase subunit A
VEFLEQTCTAKGWESLVQLVETSKPNRVLIGACLPYVFKRKLHELAQQVGLDPALIEVVDLQPAISAQSSMLNAQSNFSAFSFQLSALQTGIAMLKWAEPGPVATVPIIQKALVIGGGIGGLTAALAIADHGFKVDLVEASEQLGGNLNWLQRTLEGHSTDSLLADTRAQVEKHPNICVHTRTRVITATGDVGRFHTTIEGPQESVRVLSHGVTILATGGREAVTTSFGYGTSPSIITQKELEQKLAEGTMNTGQLNSVVMIQCVDSREEPRNYCSRVCCATALKHALHLKEKNPALAIYILYRDMMAYGFAETYYTRAREAGVIFIQYQVDDKPRVKTGKEGPEVVILEPILKRRLNIKADLVVLATGVVSNLPQDLAQNFGASVDQDGFFQEAESKWRPVDSLKEGVFACGLTHSPRNIAETIATAEAAAERALRIISREHLPAGKVLAQVHHSLCSLCERCIDACPYGARSIDFDHEKVRINPVMCQGCGTCAAVCPNSASVLEGFLEQQMFEMIDAAVGYGAESRGHGA